LLQVHSAAAARTAAEEFERRFARREVPTDVEEFPAEMNNDTRRLTSIMVAADLAKSRAAATLSTTRLAGTFKPISRMVSLKSCLSSAS